MKSILKFLLINNFRAQGVGLFLLILLWLASLAFSGPNSQKFSLKEKISNTGLLADGPEEILFVSTLDGALHAVTKSTGAKKWSLKEEPLILNSDVSDDHPLPHFFPNPQDGSLYRYTARKGREPLKKLPFTIPELVANSPCRSNDGIFYIGKKVDSWIGVDAMTGKRQLSLGADSVEKMCPKQSRHAIYLGRTLYNIVLFELNSGNKWNVSFYHYATTPSQHANNYNLVHYSAAGEGAILTVDQKSGAPLWNLEFDSPVIALYTLDVDRSLVSVPLTTITPQTLDRFASSLKDLSLSQLDPDSHDLLVKELSPTIFVGEARSGIYALPAFVDMNTARISRRRDKLLLGGPPGQTATMDTAPKDAATDDTDKDVLLLGYYDIPEFLKAELEKASPGELGSLREAGLPLGITHQTPNITEHRPFQQPQNSTHLFWHGTQQLSSLNYTFVVSGDAFKWTFKLSRLGVVWLTSDPLNFLVALLTASLGFILALLYKQAQEYARLSREMSSRRNTSRGSNKDGVSGSEVTTVAEELEDGGIKVGKIIFNPRDLLGKGCDGTFVFRGSFEGRSVAVKRILPDCFSVADREVDLLRQSDHHPNVIRYFCMEQCREFRYIALELCIATLEDLVKGRISITTSPTPVMLLRQSTSGLHHLHSLGIVHRDIKPQNVLLSVRSASGEVTAMISDFGLCKRLEIGRLSFSKRSGVTGTEGWIAPEMMLSGNATSKVDIFSLGCVFYYVLCGGKHPFGLILDRQSRIISGTYTLDDLEKDKDCLLRALIEKMISTDPSDRPPSGAVLSFPLFWGPDKVLQFFQDVSDRVEKESVNSLVMINLEWGSGEVVREDWTSHMHPVVGEDLRRFREYKGRSVRDLLRALRNKKNHYRELTDEARRVFGRIPEDFVPYWTTRFPRLLLHTWCALQGCKMEPIFSKYYVAGFNFKRDDLHETVSLSPNNRRAPPSFSYAGSPIPLTSLEATLGGPVPHKGFRNSPKHVDSGSALWLLRKPENTFEPRFQEPPEVKSTDEVISWTDIQLKEKKRRKARTRKSEDKEDGT